jgi:hypothetical protein
LTNVTREEEKRPFTKKVLERFKNIGLQGYIGDYFQTTDIVRGFLSDRSRIPRTLWCKTSTPISEDQLRELCGNESANIYVHDPKINVISEYAVSKNRFEPNKPAIVNTIDLGNKSYILAIGIVISIT